MKKTMKNEAKIKLCNKNYFSVQIFIVYMKMLLKLITLYVERAKKPEKYEKNL